MAHIFKFPHLRRQLVQLNFLFLTTLFSRIGLKYYSLMVLTGVNYLRISSSCGLL
jgi:hypothetical protein